MGGGRYPRRTKLPSTRPSPSQIDPPAPEQAIEQSCNIATADAGMGTFPALQQRESSQYFPIPSQPNPSTQASVWQPTSVYARADEYGSQTIVVNTSIAPRDLVNVPANPYPVPVPLNDPPVTPVSSPAQASSSASAESSSASSSSAGSSTASPPPRYSCRRGCDKSFTSPKDVSRHYKSRVHTPPKHLQHFVCRCGYATPRKDHHRRHLDKTSCMFSLKYFSCVCTHPPLHPDRAGHLEHINGCKAGRGQQGRPPRMMPRRSLD
ncbi:unnamed protein product [Clonostachys solani]|uniref:C2H2-type domain-containing protein n=1 Tax=Clonostachys solani TaxID=160281 RepID=A0A9N9W8B8_9HYPO|nr:unnamed protein product [Clonostachys solani]